MPNRSMMCWEESSQETGVRSQELGIRSSVARTCFVGPRLFLAPGDCPDRQATEPGAGVARTPVFGVRGSSRGETINLGEGGCPRILERKFKEEPQTPKAGVCATLAHQR
jgi:hypothetical protein